MRLDRLLVIGATGLVGSKLTPMSGAYGFEGYGTTFSRTTSLQRSTRLDITDRQSTIELIGKIRPKVVINSAAVTNVDYCESHPEEARRLNVEGLRNVAEASANTKSRLVQISTDYVFDGAFGHYTEADTPRPVNVYGRTKLEAEDIVSRLSDYAIARPSVIYGWNAPETSGNPSDSAKPMNFGMFVLDKLRKGESVKGVRDQYSSPTFANNLADALLRLAKVRDNGVFHTAGKSCMSRYEFAVRIAESFGLSTKLVQPVFSSEFKQLAPRPRYSCLRVDKAEKTLGMRFLSSTEGLSEMRKAEIDRAQLGKHS